MALPVKVVSCFGVLEYWSIGKNESPNLTCIGLFITPLLHHSNSLPQRGKTIGAALGDSSRPGLLGLDFLPFFGPSIASVAQRVHLFIQNREPGVQGQTRVQWLCQQKRFRVQGVRRKVQGESMFLNCFCLVPYALSRFLWIAQSRVLSFGPEFSRLIALDHMEP